MVYDGTTEIDIVLNAQNGAVVIETVKGDLNGDSVIDIVDCLTVLNIVSDDTYNAAADLNGDGVVNLLDVIRMLKAIVA